MTAYYNEFNPYAAQWLRNLIAAGLIAPGDVDTRSIVDVTPDDLRGYAQAHLFAGIGGWSLGARLAGWPDDRPLWTGSCPCQPFSVAGKGGAQADERHLWPVFFDLIRSCRPDVVMGEQVAAAVGKDWLDGVSDDLEGIGYACGAAVVPACAVDAPHRRDRLWFVADAAHSGRREERADAGRIGTGNRSEGWSTGRDAGRAPDDVGDAGSALALAEHGGREGRQSKRAGSGATMPSGEGGGFVSDAARVIGEDQPERLGADHAERTSVVVGSVSGADRGSAERVDASRSDGPVRGGSAWARSEWAIGADGKARRVEPGIRLLAHGVPARVGKLCAYGNAVAPPLVAEIVGAYMDTQP